MSTRPSGRRAALVFVDIQQDFCEGGSAEVPNAKDIIPICNVLRKKLTWDAVVQAQDWHPARHISFCTANILEKRYCSKGDVIVLPNGTKQRMWADHCIQNSEGADSPADLDVDLEDIVIQKGTEVDLECYSGFIAADGTSTTKLEKELKKLNVTDVYVCGLGAEYGVASTALDAVKLGFKTYVIVDGIKGADEASTKESLVKMEAGGVTGITSTVLMGNVESKEDRRAQAATYMEENNIDTLFQNLCTALVYEKPEDPKAFLVSELKRLQAEKVSKLSKISLLTEADLETMFQMLDPIKTGTLSSQQVKKAMTELGMKPGNAINDDEEYYNIAKFKQVFWAAK